MSKFFPYFLSLMAVLWMGGCQSYDSRLASHDTEYLAGYGSPAAVSNQVYASGYDPVSYWDGEGVSGKPSVKISLGEQRAYFYKSDQLVGVSPVSTGREGHDTHPGSYKVKDKDIDHVSNLYGDFVDAAGTVVMSNVSSRDPRPPGSKFKGASMPYFMHIANGVGLHAGFLPGYPASHGCIRMPEHMAEIFYANVSVGTPVTITP